MKGFFVVVVFLVTLAHGLRINEDEMETREVRLDTLPTQQKLTELIADLSIITTDDNVRAQLDKISRLSRTPESFGFKAAVGGFIRTNAPTLMEDTTPHKFSTQGTPKIVGKLLNALLMLLHQADKQYQYCATDMVYCPTNQRCMKSCQFCGGLQLQEGTCCVAMGPADCTDGQGATHASGSNWPDDCNTCYCNDGEISCTEIACGPPTPEGCLSGSRAHGESWQVDCNVCLCTDGDVCCTENDCTCRAADGFPCLFDSEGEFNGCNSDTVVFLFGGAYSCTTANGGGPCRGNCPTCNDPGNPNCNDGKPVAPPPPGKGDNSQIRGDKWLGCYTSQYITYDCYGDQEIGPDSDATPGTSPLNNPLICAKCCEKGGWKFTALAAGNECWCASQEDIQKSRSRGASECDELCVGDSRSWCGSARDIHWTVYHTGDAPQPQPQPNPPEPCTPERKCCGCDTLHILSDWGECVRPETSVWAAITERPEYSIFSSLLQNSNIDLASEACGQAVYVLAIPNSVFARVFPEVDGKELVKILTANDLNALNHLVRGQIVTGVDPKDPMSKSWFQAIPEKSDPWANPAGKARILDSHDERNRWSSTVDMIKTMKERDVNWSAKFQVESDSTEGAIGTIRLENTLGGDPMRFFWDEMCSYCAAGPGWNTEDVGYVGYRNIAELCLDKLEQFDDGYLIPVEHFILSDEMPCPAGKVMVRNSGCQPVPPGHSTDGIGYRYTATLCPAGTYTLTGVRCDLCPPGTSTQGRTGASDASHCVKCPPGYFAPEAGTPECLPCPAGSSTDGDRAQEMCTMCPPGFHAPTPGNPTCTGCSAGTFAEGEGNMDCADCPAGTSTEGKGERSTCTPCSAGSFSDREGAPTCTLCSPGWVNPAVGSPHNICRKCPPGYSTSGMSGQAECHECQQGTYSEDWASPACTDCGGGYFGEWDGQTRPCCICPAGSDTRGSTRATECTLCAPGTYAENEGTTTCSICPGGMYDEIGVPGRTTPCDQSCAAGTVSPPGATSCTDCVEGTWAGAAQAAPCTPCAAGTADNTPRRETACDPCGTGEDTNNLPGQTTCSQCVPGEFAASEGTADCLPCNKGEVNNAAGQSSCTPCGVGQDTNDLTGQTTCSACSPGEYATAGGTELCSKCTAGTAADDPGRGSVCDDCLAGTYAATTGLTECSDCGQGEYQDGTGQSGCKDCDAGTFSTETARIDACDPCLAGTYQDDTGATECEDCTMGYYQDDGGATDCKTCGAGSYSDADAATSCKTCAPGGETGSEPRTSCTPCDTGYYSTTPTDSCTQCPAGTNAAQGPGLSAVCTDCGPGAYAAQGDGCASCDPGSYQDQQQASSCTPCPCGTSQGSSGSSGCSGCSTAYYASGTGNTACSPCAAGRTDSNSHCGCTDCQPGTYAPYPGSGCRQCDPGYYADQWGTVLCHACEPGTEAFNTSTGNTNPCRACPPGEFAPEYATVSCSTCPPGYSTLGEYGAKFCTPCGPGRYCTGSCGTCSVCPSGTASPLDTATSVAACVGCAPGYYAPTSAMASCLPCPAGTYNTGPSNTGCSRCSGNFYQPLEGQDHCIPCDGDVAESGAACNPWLGEPTDVVE
eukprot:TRINITY_DN67158_c5_g1_i1.p1 TRINITY_DN67158_c5_g1~~TRINITY_DN67158_c5_g1_i1.p1  ORF type:complete len:1592 (+),score=103.74 TRINITY_DN67158_c5_g1_i1:30-4805(+)